MNGDKILRHQDITVENASIFVEIGNIAYIKSLNSNLTTPVINKAK